jgi:hypothetical protein
MSEATGIPAREPTRAPTWLRVCVAISTVAAVWQTLCFALLVMSRDVYSQIPFVFSLLVSAPIIVFVGLVPATWWTAVARRPAQAAIFLAIADLVVVGGEVGLLFSGVITLHGSSC